MLVVATCSNFNMVLTILKAPSQHI